MSFTTDLLKHEIPAHRGMARGVGPAIADREALERPVPVTAADAGGLVEQERIKHVGARSRAEGETQGLAALKVREILGEDEGTC
jgi:hypothetical protein